MSNQFRMAHAFVDWLLAEDGWDSELIGEGVAYCEGQDDVWDWDGNNDN